MLRAVAKSAPARRAVDASRYRSAVALLFAAARGEGARCRVLGRDTRPEPRVDVRDTRHRARARTGGARRLRRGGGAHDGLAGAVLATLDAVDDGVWPAVGVVRMT